MRKIMLVAASGDEDIAGEVLEALEELDYEVYYPRDAGQEGLKRIEQVDLFVLVGRQAARLSRLAGTFRRDQALSEVPKLLVTDEKALEQMDYCKLADDILLFPFRGVELAARIKMLFWRNQKVDSSHLLRAGELTINLSTYEVTVGGVLVDLTFKEYELLRYLATHRKRVHTRRKLLNRVWGEDYYGGPRTVDVHIRRIRAKIETSGQVYIQTVRGVGYRFVG